MGLKKTNLIQLYLYLTCELYKLQKSQLTKTYLQKKKKNWRDKNK